MGIAVITSHPGSCSQAVPGIFMREYQKMSVTLLLRGRAAASSARDMAITVLRRQLGGVTDGRTLKSFSQTDDMGTC